MRKFLFIAFALLMLFPWLSQALFPDESILGPIVWDLVSLALLLTILKWGKP